MIIVQFIYITTNKLSRTISEHFTILFANYSDILFIHEKHFKILHHPIKDNIIFI